MDPRCCLLAQTERCFGRKPCCSFVLFSGAYLRALTLRLMETFKAKCRALLTSRGFCGCFKNSSPIMQVHDQGQNVKRSSPSEDFWSSSAFEMEDSGVQSQRSVSMIGISNQPLDPSGSTSHPSEFVNQGLLLWIQTRQQWLGNKRSEKRTHLQKPTINWNEIYESFLWINKPFPQPIPLPEMVDFLVDVWKQEGL